MTTFFTDATFKRIVNADRRVGSEPGPSTSELIPAGGDLTLDASGNIAARAENAPDMRFAGRIVVRV